MKMKRIKAGHYATADGSHYIAKEENNRPAYWMAGEVIEGQAHHLEDFSTYKEARNWITYLKEGN